MTCGKQYVGQTSLGNCNSKPNIPVQRDCIKYPFKMKSRERVWQQRENGIFHGKKRLASFANQRDCSEYSNTGQWACNFKLTE